MKDKFMHNLALLQNIIASGELDSKDAIMDSLRQLALRVGDENLIPLLKRILVEKIKENVNNKDFAEILFKINRLTDIKLD